jgi:hypothetical protein
VNGKRAGLVTEIRKVQLRQIAPSGSASASSYQVLVDLGRRRRLILGGAQPDQCGAEALAQAVADACGVPLRRTWAEPVSVEVESST